MDCKKIIAVTVMLCLAFGVAGLCSPKAIAADITDSVEVTGAPDAALGDGYIDVTYEATETYKNSKYYENLRKIPKSGNQAINVVAIALSQVGYHEGNSHEEMNGLNAEGNRDFVEYNLMYGKHDNGQGNGHSYGYSWCASFATWCFRQAGATMEQSVQEGKDAYISCHFWRGDFAAADRFYAADGEYEPKTGDVIFFKDFNEKTERKATHLGIVIYSDGENVYTVEGNANATIGKETTCDSVAVKTHPLDSKYIVGYGQPAYENTEEKAPYGWRAVGDDNAPTRPLEELIDEAQGGAQIIPVWEEEKKGVEIIEIAIAAVLMLLLVSAVTVLSVMTFKKKPDDRNSGRRRESIKSRNKYSGKK